MKINYALAITTCLSMAFLAAKYEFSAKQTVISGFVPIYTKDNSREEMYLLNMRAVKQIVPNRAGERTTVFLHLNNDETHFVDEDYEDFKRRIVKAFD